MASTIDDRMILATDLSDDDMRDEFHDWMTEKLESGKYRALPRSKSVYRFHDSWWPDVQTKLKAAMVKGDQAWCWHVKDGHLTEEKL